MPRPASPKADSISVWLETVRKQEWLWTLSDWPFMCGKLGLVETAFASNGDFSRHSYALGDAQV